MSFSGFLPPKWPLTILYLCLLLLFKAAVSPSAALWGNKGLRLLCVGAIEFQSLDGSVTFLPHSSSSSSPLAQDL